MNLYLANRARTLVGQEVEVIHARADMGAGDQPFRLRGVLRGVDGRFLRFDNGWISLSTVESIVSINGAQATTPFKIAKGGTP